MLQTELSLAADIQRRLLPHVPPSSNGSEWAAALRPAGQVVTQLSRTFLQDWQGTRI